MGGWLWLMAVAFADANIIFLEMHPEYTRESRARVSNSARQTATSSPTFFCKMSMFWSKKMLSDERLLIENCPKYMYHSRSFPPHVICAVRWWMVPGEYIYREKHYENCLCMCLCICMGWLRMAATSGYPREFLGVGIFRMRLSCRATMDRWVSEYTSMRVWASGLAFVYTIIRMYIFSSRVCWMNDDSCCLWWLYPVCGLKTLHRMDENV